MYIHLGDLHIRDDARQAERRQILQSIITRHADDDVQGWWIPGDLFDARSTVTARNTLATILLDLAARAPVVLCYGNHDAPGDLDIFGRLRAGGHPIMVIATPQVVTLPDGAALFVLPYPTMTGLIAAGVPTSDRPAAARAALDAVFLAAGETLASVRAAGHATYMIGHATVAGARPGIGQPPIGGEIALDAALLARLGPVTYIGLNHIHMAQTVSGAVYAGSLCRLDWGETEPKGYVTITPAGAMFEPIALAPMYHVEGDLTRDGFTWRVTKGPDGPDEPPPATWVGCEVRVRARYRQREGALLTTAQATALHDFAAATRVVFEPICVPDRGVRAPEVAAARTLPEKIAAWATVTGVGLPATVGDYVADLDGAPDTETVVATVSARVAALVDVAPAVQPAAQEELV